jgi:hypothetical protein
LIFSNAYLASSNIGKTLLRSASQEVFKALAESLYILVAASSASQRVFFSLASFYLIYNSASIILLFFVLSINIGSKSINFCFIYPTYASVDLSLSKPF